MSEVAIKTGAMEDAESSARALLEICDDKGNCCNTSGSGLGLDNPGTSDRVRGGTDIYSDKAILGTCSEVIIQNCEFWFQNSSSIFTFGCVLSVHKRNMSICIKMPEGPQLSIF